MAGFTFLFKLFILGIFLILVSFMASSYLSATGQSSLPAEILVVAGMTLLALSGILFDLVDKPTECDEQLQESAGA